MFLIFMIAGVVATLFLTRRLTGDPNERKVNSTLLVALGAFFAASLFVLLGLAIWVPKANALSVLVESLAGLSLGALLVHGQVLQEFVTFSPVVEEQDEDEEDDEDDEEDEETDATQEEIDGLEEEIESLQSEIEGFEGERQEHEGTIEEKQGEIEAAKAEIDSAQAEINDINAAIAERNEQIAELRAKIRGLEDGTGQSENAGPSTDTAQPAPSVGAVVGAPTTDGTQAEPAGGSATSGGTAQPEPAAPVAGSETASSLTTSKLSLVKGDAPREGTDGTTGGASPTGATSGGENKQ